MLTPPSEVFLSYLTGLAPVGHVVVTHIDTMLVDLGYTSKFVLYRHLNELTKAGCVRRIAAGRHNSFGEFIVIRRLEELSERHVDKTEEPIVVNHTVRNTVNSATRADWLARIAEVPPDQRGLTALIAGDPLPARSALARRSLESAST